MFQNKYLKELFISSGTEVESMKQGFLTVAKCQQYQHSDVRTLLIPAEL
jgi:hypothetical protein